MLGPTAKTSFNIKAIQYTVHWGYLHAACHYLKNYRPLDSSRLNTLQCAISMVGSAMFNIQLNNRLKDIFKKAVLFYKALFKTKYLHPS